MRALSKKKAAAVRVYIKRRRVFLEANPWCVRCGGEATEVHHARGRVGGDMLDETTWRAACRGCHIHFGDFPAEAIAEGWSLPRVGRAS